MGQIHPTVNPDTERSEGLFREQIRNILNLSWDTRDDKIFKELRRIKALDTKPVSKG